MYYEDLSPYCYAVKRGLQQVVNIGWLDIGFRYNTRGTSEEFISKLKALAKRELVNVMRGIHPCKFCGKRKNSVEVDGAYILVGYAEIWVPSNKDMDLIYAAPTLIIHYCEAHNYTPPQEFVESVMDFDLNSTWSGGQEYKKRLEMRLPETGDEQVTL